MPGVISVFPPWRTSEDKLLPQDNAHVDIRNYSVDHKEKYLKSNIFFENEVLRSGALSVLEQAVAVSLCSAFPLSLLQSSILLYKM